jgi:hypothetical protein
MSDDRYRQHGDDDEWFGFAKHSELLTVHNCLLECRKIITYYAPELYGIITYRKKNNSLLCHCQ